MPFMISVPKYEGEREEDDLVQSLSLENDAHGEMSFPCRNIFTDKSVEPVGEMSRFRCPNRRRLFLTVEFLSTEGLTTSARKRCSP